VDPLREKDIGIEKCEVAIEDDAGEAKSRFIVKMTCRHGANYPLILASSKPNVY
jgi:cell cycle checkpoint control protein RAD9A